MKNSKLMIAVAAGISASAGMLGMGGYKYSPSKSSQSQLDIALHEARALDKAKRKGWKHEHGKFAKA